MSARHSRAVMLLLAAMLLAWPACKPHPPGPGGDGGALADMTATDGGEHGPTPETEVESEYTPRRPHADEEECDEVAREVLARLRLQGEKISKRSDELTQRERALLARSEALTAVEKQIGERVAELERLSVQLEQRFSHPQKQAEAERSARKAEAQRRLAEQVRSNSQLIGSMPPSKAAALLAQMKDTTLAAAVLRALPGELAGRVLGQMRPEVSARLMERREDQEGEPAALAPAEPRSEAKVPTTTKDAKDNPDDEGEAGSTTGPRRAATGGHGQKL